MAILIGNGNSDFLFGTNAADLILGLGGDDFLFGLGGDDTIDGGAGDDSVNGGAGGDTLHGGRGIDTLNYFDSSAGVSVSLGDGGTSEMLAATRCSEVAAMTCWMGAAERIHSTEAVAPTTSSAGTVVTLSLAVVEMIL